MKNGSGGFTLIEVIVSTMAVMCAALLLASCVSVCIKLSDKAGEERDASSLLTVFALKANSEHEQNNGTYYYSRDLSPCDSEDAVYIVDYSANAVEEHVIHGVKTTLFLVNISICGDDVKLCASSFYTEERDG